MFWDHTKKMHFAGNKVKQLTSATHLWESAIVFDFHCSKNHRTVIFRLVFK